MARRSATIGAVRLVATIGAVLVALAPGVIFVAVPMPARPGGIPVAAVGDATFAEVVAAAGRVAASATTAVATGATHVPQRPRARPRATAQWQKPGPQP